jgi:hypothetical protein
VEETVELSFIEIVLANYVRGSHSNAAARQSEARFGRLRRLAPGSGAGRDTACRPPPGRLAEPRTAKYDGHRLVPIVAGDEVKLISRNGRDRTTLFRLPFDGLAGLPPLRLDGEITLTDERDVTISTRSPRRCAGAGTTGSPISPSTSSTSMAIARTGSLLIGLPAGAGTCSIPGMQCLLGYTATYPPGGFGTGPLPRGNQ